MQYLAAMRKSIVIEHFGSQVAVARVFGITRQNVCSWSEDRIPEKYAARIDKMTNGKLAYDHTLYMRNG